MTTPLPCFSAPSDDLHRVESKRLHHLLGSSTSLLRKPVFTAPPLSPSSWTKVFPHPTTVLKSDSSLHDSSWSIVLSEHHATTGSPILLLPTELLLEIFKWTCAVMKPSMSSEPPSEGPHSPPVIILTQICQNWRTIIHRTPALWQHLTLAPRMGITPLRSPITQWLKRVGDYLPIDISITDINLQRGIRVTSSPIFSDRVERARVPEFHRWLTETEARLSSHRLSRPTVEVEVNPILDFLLPQFLLTSSKSFRSIQTHLPIWSYVPKSGPLGLLQHAPLDVPRLQSLDLTFSYMGLGNREIRLNRSRRLYDEAFVDGVVNTFSVAPELKEVKIAYDGESDRMCEMHHGGLGAGGRGRGRAGVQVGTGEEWNRDYKTGVEIFDLPYDQLESLEFDNVTTKVPMDMRRILAAGVNLKKASLVIGDAPTSTLVQDDWEDLYTDFAPNVYGKYTYGAWKLVEEDDVEGLGVSDDAPEGYRYVPPPVPPTLTLVPRPESKVGGTVPVAQLTKLKSLHLTLHGPGGAAQFLRGFSFPALEELSIIHAVPISRDEGEGPIAGGTNTPPLSGSDLDGSPLTPAEKARTRQQLTERVRASAYPYEILGSFLLHLQTLSSTSFSSMHTLRLENLHGVNTHHLLRFIDGVGSSLKTICIQYCPNLDLGVFARGMSRFDEEEGEGEDGHGHGHGQAVLAPNLKTFILEADLTRSGDDPNDIVNMLAKRICPTSPHTACPDDGHRKRSKIASIGIRFFGKDLTENSRKYIWKFKALHGIKVRAKCWL